MSRPYVSMSFTNSDTVFLYHTSHFFFKFVTSHLSWQFKIIHVRYPEGTILRKEYSSSKNAFGSGWWKEMSLILHAAGSRFTSPKLPPSRGVYMASPDRWYYQWRILVYVFSISMCRTSSVKTVNGYGMDDRFWISGRDRVLFLAMIPDWLWIPPRLVFSEIFGFLSLGLNNRGVMLYPPYHLMSTWRTLGAIVIFTHTPYFMIIMHEGIFRPTFFLILLIQNEVLILFSRLDLWFLKTTGVEKGK
jgi:hypothetical protein